MERGMSVAERRKDNALARIGATLAALRADRAAMQELLTQKHPEYISRALVSVVAWLDREISRLMRERAGLDDWKAGRCS